MGATTLSNDFRSLSRQPPADPDIQATLSDFLTYTEHFPSHLTRALALIENQRACAERQIHAVHEDTTTWSLLPSLKNGTSNRPDPIKLRRDISYALEEAERASRMALEEAIRLDETCAREARRLNVVVEKLKAQPEPPSREPTPPPAPPSQQRLASTSPALLKRERRTNTRYEDERLERASRKLNDKAATKLRGKSIMVPGEVLPPPDPNAPFDSASEWTTPRQSSPIEEASEEEAEIANVTPNRRSRTPKPPGSSNRDRKTPKARIPRAPGQPGTNAHSAVAGISTSNALLALTKPPVDAVQGSKWLPWMALTEWEMAKLRKRMKKNAIWVPSQTMVRRELKNLGRGLAGKEAARQEAERTGGVFVDEQSNTDPTKTLASGEEAAHTAVLLDDKLYDGGAADNQDQELINRGMRLNEAKKLKRQKMLEEQALQAQLAREQGVDTSSADKKLSSSPTDAKKRKRDSSPAMGPSVSSTTAATDTTETAPKPPSKKLKIRAPTPPMAGTSKVPLAPAGASPPKASASRHARAATPPATGRRPTTTILLKAAKAVSEEPPNRRASLRRSSNASLPSGTTLSSTTGPSRPAATTTTGRRTRRPAPGILSSADAESATVGYSKRRNAPRKKAATATTSATSTTASSSTRLSTSSNTDRAASVDGQPPDEDIDPDEPRYCICGNVSWGTMIACDADDCEKEWFHLSCVGLEDLPPRRTKWFCPDCRRRMKLPAAANGLVGRGQIGAGGVGR